MADTDLLEQSAGVVHAAQSGDEAAVRAWVAGGGDVNKADEGGWAPLHVAASAGRLSAVEVLLMSGADVAASTSAGGSALTYAASKGHLAIVAALLEAGADVRHADRGGSTPLHRAASRGHIAILERLLAAKGARAAQEKKDKMGFTPFHVSVVEQQEEALLLLATAGSDVETVDAEGVKASDLLPDRLRAQLLEG